MPNSTRLDSHKKAKDLQAPQTVSDSQPEDASAAIQASSFRNVSSCTRCRQRKSRCDQQLPQCGACEKAGARCVGYDPLMKREVPRSYLYYLEDRVSYFKDLLSEHGVQFKPDSALNGERRPGELAEERDAKAYKRRGSLMSTSATDSTHLGGRSPGSSAGEASMDGASHPAHDMMHPGSDPGCCPAHELLFALQTTRIPQQPAELPTRDRAAKLVNFYFEQAYPQVPALRKEYVLNLFNLTYAGEENRHPYNLFLLYIVFAIGTCIMLDSEGNLRGDQDGPTLGSKRRRNNPSRSHPAEEYYTAAVTQLALAFETCDDATSKLDGLQAAVLVAHLSLFYPIRPGPVYLVGLALRGAVDMRLFDEAAPELINDGCEGLESTELAITHARITDQCQRLWWGAYSLDRLVSPYTRRPFGITDHIITTGFPSMTTESATQCPGISSNDKLMNFLTGHLLQLRLLQSEIHEVLQYHHAQSSRKMPSLHSAARVTVSSSPLDYFDSFSSWKRDINRRLDEWKSCIPSREETGTWVPIVRLELDYWKTINLLYRQEMNVPSELASMLPPLHKNSPRLASEGGSKDDFTFFKIVEASRKVLQSYRLVHHLDSGNCTFLATHNIFLAGSLFLYAIWNSPLIRNLLTLDEIDCTILTGTAVLAGMMDIYPHARECQDALERMRVATMQMCLSTTKAESNINTPRELPTHTPTSTSTNTAARAPTEKTPDLLQNTHTPRGVLRNGGAPLLSQFGIPARVSEESDLPGDFENALTQLFPHSENTPQFTHDDLRSFSTSAPDQYRLPEPKGEPVVSLDFLDIEMWRSRHLSSSANRSPENSREMEALLRDASNPDYSNACVEERPMDDFVDIPVL